MPDEILDHWREYGRPVKRCDYTRNQDGSVSIRTPGEAACLSDFSELDFYVETKKKPKLKTSWRK